MTAKRELLDLLLENARYSTEDLARMTDLSEEEVVSTIETLEDEDIIRGYQAVVDWHRVKEEHIRAEVELNVTLDRDTSYDDIADRLAKFPEVTTLQLVSGDYDFHLEVEGDSLQEVSNFISEKVARAPEITQTVTHYVMETYKDRGIEFEDGHDDDDRLSISP
jgi:DNA-binding Lrp family transcriptional regulator